MSELKPLRYVTRSVDLICWRFFVDSFGSSRGNDFHHHTFKLVKARLILVSLSGVSRKSGFQIGGFPSPGFS